MKIITVEKTNFLAILVAITLIVNVVLGIELYYSLHSTGKTAGEVPITLSNLTIITPSQTVTTTETITSTVTSSSTITTTSTTASGTVTSTATSTSSTQTTQSNSTLYSFSIKVKFELHVNATGEYIIGIHPQGFKELYMLIYLEDGRTITLSLNNTYAILNITDMDIDVTMYITGKSYSQMSPQQILQNLGLYYQLIQQYTSSTTSTETNED